MLLQKKLEFFKKCFMVTTRCTLKKSMLNQLFLSLTIRTLL